MLFKIIKICNFIFSSVNFNYLLFLKYPTNIIIVTKGQPIVQPQISKKVKRVEALNL